MNTLSLAVGAGHRAPWRSMRGVMAALSLAAALGLVACSPPSPAQEPPKADPPAKADAQKAPPTPTIPDAPNVKASPEEVDFGAIKADEQATREVKLYNMGAKPITFTRVSTSCGCVSGEVEQREIQSGDFATLTCHWHAGPINQTESSKTFWIFTSDGGRPVSLTVKASVTGGQAPGEVHAPVSPEAKALPLQVEVSTNELDMGYLKPEHVGNATVTIKNVGTQPLEFTRVTTNCSCATGEITHDPVKPGESADLKVTMTAGPNIGVLRRELKVWASGYATPITVNVQAMVSHEVNAEPFFVNMLAGRTGEITLEATDGKPFRVLSANGEAPKYVGDDTGAPALKHVIEWDMSAVANENLPHWYIVETDHPGMPLIDLRVIHPSLFPTPATPAPWTPTNDHLLLGRLRPGQSVTQEITLVKLLADTLAPIEATDGVFTAEVVSREVTDRGLKCKIKITPVSAAPGAVLHGSLILRSTNPEHSETIEVFAKMEPGT